MKLSLLYLLTFAFALLKGDTSLFTARQASVGVNAIHDYKQSNVSNSTNKRSPVDLFVAAACCDDDDDDFEIVKKKTGSAVSFLLNDICEEVLLHSELKRTQRFAVYSHNNSQPVYIFQRELLI